jgi:hypothetical protein
MAVSNMSNFFLLLCFYNIEKTGVNKLTGSNFRKMGAWLTSIPQLFAAWFIPARGKPQGRRSPVVCNGCQTQRNKQQAIYSRAAAQDSRNQGLYSTIV